MSRLLAEFADRVAATSAVVLSADEHGDAGWVEQLVRSYTATATLTRLRADAGTDAAALAALCPLVGLRLGVPPRVDDVAPEVLLNRLLSRISQRTPVLVVLDGIAPPPPLTQSPQARVNVVSGLRTESASDVSGPTFTLEALGVADVATLLHAALQDDFTGGAELTTFVMAETNGVARDVVAVCDALTRMATEQPDASAMFNAVRAAVPYKGLQVFDDGDAVRFHGRESAIADVMDSLESEPFVAVVGSSGSGKSSVIRAGCLPRLTATSHRIVVMSPGDDPLRALNAVWPQAAGDDDPTSLVRSGDGCVVLVIDQLEECFTLSSDEAARDLFLRTGLRPRCPGVRVLATLRGDFYGRASEHAGLAAALRSGTVLMTPPGFGVADGDRGPRRSGSPRGSKSVSPI